MTQEELFWRVKALEQENKLLQIKITDLEHTLKELIAENVEILRVQAEAKHKR